MPAESEKQRRAMCAALAAKRGKGTAKGPSKQMAESMTESQLEDFCKSKVAEMEGFIRGFIDECERRNLRRWEMKVACAIGQNILDKHFVTVPNGVNHGSVKEAVDVGAETATAGVPPGKSVPEATSIMGDGPSMDPAGRFMVELLRRRRKEMGKSVLSGMSGKDLIMAPANRNAIQSTAQNRAGGVTFSSPPPAPGGPKLSR